MSTLLPKGHVSCLSNAFRYTPASHTNISNTFARIRRELTELSATASPRALVEIAGAPRKWPFSLERVQAARRLLTAGGLRPRPQLVASDA